MLDLNEIYFMDCLKGMPLIPDKSVDLIFADLPFGTTQCPWDVIIPFAPLWANYERIITDNGAILLFAQTPFDKVLGASNLKLLRYEWIWEKTSATGHYNAGKMPLKAHENILVFYKNLPVYNPQKTTGHPRKVSTAKHKANCKESKVYGKNTHLTSYDSTERFPRSVITFSSDKQTENLHSTQKPLSLCKYFIETYTNPGMLVLDNCTGSGTIPVGCIETDRNFIAFENDWEIFTTAKNRILTVQLG